MEESACIVFTVFIVLCFLMNFWRKIYILILTLPRDLRVIWRLIKLQTKCKQLKQQNATVISEFNKIAATQSEYPCFIFKQQTWTFKQIEDYSWRVARAFSRRGLVHGDVVALVCTNRPEFVATWLGLSRLGVVTALINTNQRHEALKHSLNVANPRVIIVSADLCRAVLEIKDALPDDSKLLCLFGKDQDGEKCDPAFGHFDQELSDESPTPIPGLTLANYKDPLMYIYTSGTTGLPKAAIVTNSRFLYVAYVTYTILGLRAGDRLYSPLPLYHTAGGMVAVAPTLCLGLSTVMRDKFSASAYFRDCVENHCTVGLYIGEICRYLLTSAPSEWDRKHKLRLMTGNGLRTAIWQQFVDRFNVPCIAELYGATEGNCNMANMDGTVGAVGFLPNCIPTAAIPVALAKVDPDSGEIIRSGKNNFAEHCKAGELGMMVGKIEKGDVLRDYKGYVNKEASNKKIARDLFSFGDKYFLTGDILEMDEKGYLYFKDRTGDTFRWKGENVSTAEVEAAVSKAIGLRDACVYGVQVPNTEGRAGMAAILDPDGSLDLSSLAADLQVLLPAYAQPLFLRITDKIELTGTYKLRKVDMQKEGIDPEKIKDKFYMKRGDKYVEFTSSLHQDLLEGRIRV